MQSFFEKLKNSMGVEETEEVEIEEEKPRPKAKKIQIKSALKEETEEGWFEPEGELAVDVYQTDSDIVIQSTIAGVKADELEISIENDTISISGERKHPDQNGEKNYYYQECYWGPFSRQIVLPEEVDFGRAEAEVKDGIFTLRIPKLNRKQVRKIKVRG